MKPLSDFDPPATVEELDAALVQFAQKTGASPNQSVFLCD
ncbi:MAG: hypothetical protein CBC10_011015 [Gammaproteobacteria bacterium TMED50]|nr:MAG: hypothetical protein CBC10_011015 [Gammaproteobacteria bacterium TMED50]